MREGGNSGVFECLLAAESRRPIILSTPDGILTLLVLEAERSGELLSDLIWDDELVSRSSSTTANSSSARCAAATSLTMTLSSINSDVLTAIHSRLLPGSCELRFCAFLP